ncbi:MAG: ribosome maturation factor RimM [Caldimonas sp.]
MAATADSGWPDDALEVGRIVDAWGIKGSFRVQAYAAEPGALLTARRWHLQPPDGEPVRRGTIAPRIPTLLDITAAREHGDGLVATARDIGDRTAAEALRGARVFLGRSTFPAPGADEFYWADLIGLAVANRSGTPLGTVAGLIDNGPQSVLRVQTEGEGEERLIPFVAAYVDGVDLAAGTITVDWQLDY